MPTDDEVTTLLGPDYGTVLWEASPQRIEQAQITRYQRWLAQRGVAADGYARLAGSGRSASQPGSGTRCGITSACSASAAPGLPGELPDAEWFAGTTLNYARNALRTALDDPDRVAVIGAAEDAAPRRISYGQLAAEVARVQAALRAWGSAAATGWPPSCLPTIPEALIAMLATASLGADLVVLLPDFGARSVIDRFAQISPTVLLAVGGYRYGGKEFSRDEAVAEIIDGLPGLAAVITVGPPPGPGRPGRGRAGRGGHAARDELPGLLARAGPESRRCRSAIRCGCSTPPAPPACPRRSCTGTAGSSSSTSRPSPSTRTWAPVTRSSGTPRPAG